MNRFRSFTWGLTALPLALLVVAVAIAGDASVRHDFAPSTPARASEVNENFRVLAEAINANAPKRTLLSVGTETTVSPTASPDLMLTIGSFTKQSDDTDVTVRFRSSVVVPIAASVEYALRLTGTPSEGGPGNGHWVFGSGQSAVADTVDTWAHWRDLPAGTYSLEVWLRTFSGTANGVRIGVAGAGLPVALVEESYSN